MEQIYTPTQNYKVLVHTITYNQAKYITDTLDGVAMQQTIFRIKILKTEHKWKNNH